MISLQCVDNHGRKRDLPATLSYTTADPYAVHLVFHTDAGAVPWVFARDLLIAGSADLAGAGDVAVWPSLNPEGYPVVVFELDALGVCVVAQANARDIDRFVGRTLALVAQGTEVHLLDLDRVIDQLLLTH